MTWLICGHCGVTRPLPDTFKSKADLTCPACGATSARVEKDEHPEAAGRPDSGEEPVL